MIDSFRRKNNKGFTLIEILVVVGIIAVVGLALVTNYFATVKKVRFVRDYEAALHVFRNARSFAINSSVGSNEFGEERIGIIVEGGDLTTKVQAFVDNGPNNYQFDACDEEDEEVACDLLLGEDVVSYDSRSTLADFKVEYDDYGFELLHPSGVDFPVYVYYEGNTGDVSFFDSDNVVFQNAVGDEETVVYFRFSTASKDISKDIMILRISGIPEPINAINE